MRNVKERRIGISSASENPEYLKGYRDGVRSTDGGRFVAGDGLLGALLAIALMAGVGYHYATTGRLLPTGVEINPRLPLPDSQR
ncbi:hypothetical protein AB3R30_24150 [Leptolyngbyaceae cyanobacterium UHCC 1019]